MRNPPLLAAVLAVALLAPGLTGAQPLPTGGPTPAVGGAPAGLGVSTPADDPAAARARVEALLAGHHGLVPAAVLDKAAPDVAAVLRTIAADAETFPPRRYAAFEALMRWPDAATRVLYRAALAPDQPTGLRHRVARYHAQAFGAAALPELKALLADPDADLRVTAAVALNDLKGLSPLAAAEVAAALAGALKAEADTGVRAELGRVLAGRDALR